MRTKTLLMAGAALAFSLATSQDQVYSANIVGYWNYVSSTVNPKFEMIANPLDNGASNTIAALFPSPPGGTQLQIWNGSGFNLYAYSIKAGGWGANGSVQLPPGVGFFISIGGSGVYSNTFVGSVVPAVGIMGTNVINTGFQTLSSMVPYADSVSNTATINLVVPGGTQIQEWNVANQGYDLYNFSTKAGGWTPSVPTLQVGQGIFINNLSGSPINWVQTGP